MADGTVYGGTRIDLFREHRTELIGHWWHPGAHPSAETNLRYGRLADGRWFVQHTSMPSIDWAFARQDDADLAVAEYLAMRTDGKWQTRLDPLQADAEHADQM